MHEMSLCQALLGEIEEIARSKGAARVSGVTLEIGALAGVDPAQFRGVFAVMRAGGVAAQAALVIETIGVRIECRNCGRESPAAPNRLICAACGGYRTRVVAGEEMRLRRVELHMAESHRAVAA